MPITEKQKWKTGPAKHPDGWRKLSLSPDHNLFLTAHESNEILSIEEEGKSVL